MPKNRNVYLLFAILIVLLSVAIINGCGDDATTTVVPTATPTTNPVTPTSTIAPTSTTTPTPVPTVKDVSDQFSISADYYIITDGTTGVNSGTLIIQLYQKTTSDLSIKGFELSSTYNPDFPFFGAVQFKGNFNNPPDDWATKSDLTLLQWQGNTPLTKGNVYAFNTRYPNIASMPKTLTISLAGNTVTTTTKEGAGADTATPSPTPTTMVYNLKLDVPVVVRNLQPQPSPSPIINSED